MTPTATSQPKRRDWAALDRQHQRRGTLAFTLLLNPDVLKPPVRKVGRGRPQRYTDTFVEALLMMRVALRLPYRVLEGAARQPFGPVSTPACWSIRPASKSRGMASGTPANTASRAAGRGLRCIC